MRTVLLLCSLCWALPCLGQIYRWEDAQGRVHYGNQPPSDAQLLIPEQPKSSSTPQGLRDGEREKLKQIQSEQAQRRKYAAEQARKAAQTQRSEALLQSKREEKCRYYTDLQEEIRADLRRWHTSQQGVKLRRQEHKYGEQVNRWCMTR